MWQDSIIKRRRRYLYLLEGTGVFFDAARETLLLQDSEGGGKEYRSVVIKDVTACVLAPAVNAFVIWVLKAAIRKKISRLYFLARDGYFMYTTAKMLCERLYLPIECRYLSCSRYSLRIPMFHFNVSEAFDYIVRGGIDVTLDKVLNRAGLSEGDKADVIKDIGDEFSEGVIPYADLGKLRTRLEASDVFISALKRISEEAFPAARDYLEQEGLFGDEKYALVDSGWTGSMQKVLGQLLEKCGHGRTLHGFYWGLYELPADVYPESYECFYFGPTFGMRRKTGFSNCLFESIFSAPHGMTLGYRMEGKAVLPVYADIREENREFNVLTGRLLETFTDALINGAINKSEQEELNPLEGARSLFKIHLIKKRKDVAWGKYFSHGVMKRFAPERRDVLRALLDTFMSTPSRSEAAVYGSLPFSDDVLDENEQQVAAVMSRKELEMNHPLKKIMILTGASKEKIRESAWYEGSAVRNGEDVDRHLRAYRMYKRMLYGKKEAVRLKAKYVK